MATAKYTVSRTITIEIPGYRLPLNIADAVDLQKALTEAIAEFQKEAE